MDPSLLDAEVQYMAQRTPWYISLFCQASRHLCLLLLTCCTCKTTTIRLAAYGQTRFLPGFKGVGGAPRFQSAAAGQRGPCADSAALRLAARACQSVVPGSRAWSRLSQSKDLPVLVVGVWQLFGSCLVAVWLPCASAVVV
ncbi:predicted protein [Histoplasma capsulatum G186AR]|uniref:Uncharacterized protein n=1 Tax=Ajellomyces capsulatus (strain G186AR / H82 / ATCC MYA-2454 / RMSCC 2432) TaxID=447093 RepID=C0NY10_AJECG|nr:uncharacterized protein HCBG_07804 [Histoplasma capsulatum G186AR]EEH03678.1 predicted protein [Histoplasma capsulatum G186AR]